MGKIFAQGAFGLNLLKLFSGNLPAHALSFLVTPLVTRLYSPKDVGIAGLVMVYVVLVTSLTSLKYEYAVVAEKSENKAYHLLWVCLWLALPLSLFVWLVAGGLIVFEAFGFGIVPLTALPLLFLLVYASTQVNTIRYWFVRQEDFARISFQVLSLNVARALGLVALGFFKMGWLGYLIAELLGRVVSFLPLRRALKSKGNGFRSVTMMRAKALMRRHQEFAKITVPSTFIDNLAASVPALFVAKGFGPEMAGWFVLAHRMVLGAAGLFSGVVADTFHGRIAKYYRSQPDYAFTFYKKTALFLLSIAIPPVLLLFFWGTNIFTLIFGNDWKVSGELAVIMAPWAFCILTVSPLSRVVIVFNWQKSKLIYDACVLLSTVGAVLICLIQGLSIHKSIVVLTGVNVACYAVYFVILFFLVRGHSRQFRKAQSDRSSD